MFKWMLWTTPSIIGISGIIGMIIGINILDVFRPGYARKGFLPIETTRGDRVFICLIISILIWLLWLRFFPDVSLLWSFTFLTPLIYIFMKWG